MKPKIPFLETLASQALEVTVLMPIGWIADRLFEWFSDHKLFA
jgi:hypothetical protein